MNKVTVTKVQLEAVELKRDRGISLDNVIKYYFGGADTPLHHMSVEQIVLAWHGHAEVEQEYVSFDEAYKARKEGKEVLFHINGLAYELYPNHEISKTWADKYSLLDLLNGKFTIEGDTNG